MGSTKEIRDLTGPALASAGLELWDVELDHDVVRILVDRPGGIDLEALSQASAVISPLLDEHDEVVPAGRYQLEVSSPGLERTLRTPDQYRRFVDAEVTVKTSGPVEGSRRHRGRLLAADDQGIRLRPQDAGDEAVLELTYDQIDRTRTVLVWGPTPAPHAAGRGTRRPAPAHSTAGSEPKDTGS